MLVLVSFVTLRTVGEGFMFFVSAWWIWTWKRSPTVDPNFLSNVYFYKLNTNKHIDFGEVLIFQLLVSLPVQIFV